jgi:integrase/recombinase XerC
VTGNADMIAAYLEHLRTTGDSPAQTMRDRGNILARLDQVLPYGLDRVSTEELRTWLHNPDWSQNTKATYWRCIRSFYGWAADPRDPWIDADPTDGMSPVRTADSVARACTDDELAQILARAAEPFRTWAILAAYQALRCCEISRLNRADVTERQLFVHGKGGRPRVHDTDPQVWSILAPLPAGPVARVPGSGERATPFEVSMLTRDHFHRDLKVKTSLHKLRHWCGTTVQREGKDIRVTMAVLGHRQMSSTQIYTAATDEQQRAARSTLPRFA